LTDGASPEFHVFERRGGGRCRHDRGNASWIPSNICLFARLTETVAARYNKWMDTSLFDQVRKLPLEEQLELVEALWDSIGDRNAVPGPTDAQKAELDRRIADHAANPDDVVAWDEVRDSALTRIGR
jgi:putative addiction module component (TIGR02574 family)